MDGPRNIQWARSYGGALAPYAVHAGVDGNAPLFVARGRHLGAVVPGKLHVGHNSVYIPYGGKEIAVADYEVLVAPQAALSWVQSSNGTVPRDAVVGGQDTNGETYYIGRAITNGTVTVGKVHPSHRCCYVPYGGQEVKATNYEVLVRNMYGVHLRV